MSGMKREKQISLRVSAEDWELMMKAAQVAWPKAAMSRAAIVTSLARWKAEEILAAKPRK